MKNISAFLLWLLLSANVFFLASVSSKKRFYSQPNLLVYPSDYRHTQTGKAVRSNVIFCWYKVSFIFFSTPSEHLLIFCLCSLICLLVTFPTPLCTDLQTRYLCSCSLSCKQFRLTQIGSTNSVTCCEVKTSFTQAGVWNGLPCR